MTFLNVIVWIRNLAAAYTPTNSQVFVFCKCNMSDGICFLFLQYKGLWKKLALETSPQAEAQSPGQRSCWPGLMKEVMKQWPGNLTGQKINLWASHLQEPVLSLSL